MPVVCGERRSANRTKWTQENRKSVLEKQTFPSQPLRQNRFPNGEGIRAQIWDIARGLQPQFFEIDRLVGTNSRRVRKACRAVGLGPHHFAGSSGYGHGDLGRQALDKVLYCHPLSQRCRAGGTHAIAAALFGVLRDGHELICVTGSPYDTLHDVIGHRNTHSSRGSLLEWGVSYKQIELDENGGIDHAAVMELLREDRSQVVYLQRSCGYAMRPTLRIQQIQQLADDVKKCHPNCLVVVDNCYGEFTEEQEPTHIGVDLIMGSLIKNPGGTIVSTGGYVAGRQDLMEQVHARLTAPGIGIDAGSVPGETLRLMFQGFCLAPQMVGEALKSGLLLSHVLSAVGYHVSPLPTSDRPFSFITAIELGSESEMVRICNVIQKLCPVGSYVHPIPGQTAGYEDAVIFADGTFIDGSTSELSADGPIRPPYTLYCQGGTHWTQWAEALESILTELSSQHK